MSPNDHFTPDKASSNFVNFFFFSCKKHLIRKILRMYLEYQYIGSGLVVIYTKEKEETCCRGGDYCLSQMNSSWAYHFHQWLEGFDLSIGTTSCIYEFQLRSNKIEHSIKVPMIHYYLNCPGCPCKRFTTGTKLGRLKTYTSLLQSRILNLRSMNIVSLCV